MSETSEFDEILDEATRRNGRSVVGIKLKMKIISLVCQGGVDPKYVLNSIQKKLNGCDPRVALLSLQILDYCVKYCGSLIQNEVATKGYMVQLQTIIKATDSVIVQKSLLQLIEIWAHTFRNVPRYSVIQDTLSTLKAEGYDFLLSRELTNCELLSDKDQKRQDNYCLRCSIAFSLEEIKLHCESCGKIFCSQCVVRTSTLPEFGEDKVLVCESCQRKITLTSFTYNINQLQEKLRGRPTSQVFQDLSFRRIRSEWTEEKEREEFQLAIAKSLLEAEKLNEAARSLPGTSTNRESSSLTQSECPVCCERQIDSILFLCGHSCMCYKCSVEQWKGKGNGHCPLCRTVIDDVIQINLHPLTRRML